MKKLTLHPKSIHSVRDSIERTLGRRALLLLVTGIGTAVLCLAAQATSVDDTFYGTDAGANITTGLDDSGFGYRALFSNTTSSYNTATGAFALFYNTGSENTSTGAYALFYNTTGSYNTANGAEALLSNTTGVYNTGTGYEALYSNTTGGSNTASGYAALVFNSTGNNNAASGFAALYNNTTGSNSTAHGANALLVNTTGNSNTALGNNALLANTTGGSNIAVGDAAGSLLTTGSNNIDIGNKGAAGEANTIRLGKKGTQTATYVAGIRGTTVAGGIAVLIDTNGRLGTTTSSARYKDNIKPMDKASEAILALKPVTFCYKKNLDPAGIPQFGLVAEQVEKVNADLVARDEAGKPYTVRYDAVNAMLLNEFLKEHRKVEQLTSTVAMQEAEIAEQKKDMKGIAASLKEQASQMQKVRAQLELNKHSSRAVVNNE